MTTNWLALAAHITGVDLKTPRFLEETPLGDDFTTEKEVEFLNSCSVEDTEEDANVGS